MPIERCRDIDCRRAIKITETGEVGKAIDLEEVICPYCGFTYTRKSHGIISVEEASPEEEAAFNAENPL